MNTRDWTKIILGIAATSGTGLIVSNVIKATTPLDSKPTQKILIGVGAMAITGMVSGMVTEYTELQVDVVFNTINQLRIKQQNVVIVEEG